MVILHVKKADKSLFLYETKATENINKLLKDLVLIYNGKLKIERLCYEIEELSKYGVSFPPNMLGLLTEQISELNLEDEWAKKNLNSSDYKKRPDPSGRRNGLAPSQKYDDVLTKTTAEAKTRVSQKLVESGVCLNSNVIKDTLDILKGAVMISYPMGLPSYDIIQQELDGTEDLSGTQAGKEVLKENEAELWWASKLLDGSKTLSDYIGKNEKTKVIVKLQNRGHGPPAREPIMTEEQKKALMLAQFKRQEELKKLETDDDDSHMDSQWADNKHLQKSFLGLNNIRFR